MPPLGKLFETVGRGLSGPMGEFFVGTGVNMQAVAGRPPQTAMKLQLEQMELGLTSEETAMVMELAGALGRYDLGGQARLIGLYRQRIQRRIQGREAEQQEKSRAWMTASLCCGLMLVLMLL